MKQEIFQLYSNFFIEKKRKQQKKKKEKRKTGNVLFNYIIIREGNSWLPLSYFSH